MKEKYEWFISKIRGDKPAAVEQSEEVDEPLPTITYGGWVPPVRQLATDPFDPSGPGYMSYDAWRAERDVRIKQQEFMRQRDRFFEESYRTRNEARAGIREQITNTERSVHQSAHLNPLQEYQSRGYVVHTGALGYQRIQDVAAEYHQQYQESMIRFQQELAKHPWWEEKKKIMLNANTKTI